ncbi:hypothetical protein PF008_g18378 [Phytophthora fragariae]|uniref:Crinkler effector protein N-terminal domain-containing protein n=1 Tax=Phytophthora fragariae TaxID=53985 RepID=A0A6G0R6N4_9STRA|nr:hypothetical protein PF008_g18378 [Phytophthora fragariae]
MCTIVGGTGSTLDVGIDNGRTINQLTETIKDRSDGLIKDPWPSLQLFLAKKDEGRGPWLTQLDAVQGVSGTSGYKRLLFPDAKLRDVGLARRQLGGVSDKELAVGKSPVHVLVKLPE